MSESGHQATIPRAPLCQLLPAADMPLHRPMIGVTQMLYKEQRHSIMWSVRIRQSRNGRLWNVERGHSGLMLAAWITLPHFSVSAAMSLPNSVGRTDECCATQIGKPRLHLGIGKASGDLLVELLDDFGGRRVWCAVVPLPDSCTAQSKATARSLRPVLDEPQPPRTEGTLLDQPVQFIARTGFRPRTMSSSPRLGSVASG
jgi:hypothetical protein